MQPSMEKMSSDLNVKKMEDVSKLYKLYFKNYMTHKFISSCPCSSATSGLFGRWPDPSPVQILNWLCKNVKSLVSANHFELLFNKPSLGASLPSSGWRCFHKPRRPSHSLIFFIQHFPFSIRCNDKTQFQGKLWTILVSSPILTKWWRCHWWWWHPKLRCQPLLLLLDTRLDTRTFYYYSTRTRLEVKKHYSQGTGREILIQPHWNLQTCTKIEPIPGRSTSDPWQPGANLSCL